MTTVRLRCDSSVVERLIAAQQVGSSTLSRISLFSVQWSEDMVKTDPFFGRSRARFRVRPWVSNTIARDHLA